MIHEPLKREQGEPSSPAARFTTVVGTAELVVLILILSLFAVVTIHAQPDTLWLKTYGDAGGEHLLDAIQSNTGGYLLFGYRYYYADVTYCLTKVDTEFNEIWSREAADSGHLYGLGVCETPGGDVIVAGNGHYSGNVTYGLTVKISAEGDSLWANYYGGRNAGLLCAVSTLQGAIVLGGQTVQLSENGGFDAYLLWIDEEGEVLDERAYGGRGNDMFTDITTTSDGGFIAAGNTESYGRNLRFYLVKIDSTGDEEWSQSYGADSTVWGTTVIQTSDGGYILGGKRYDNDGYMGRDEDMFIVRTDANGELLWQRAYGGYDPDMCWSIKQMEDGGFLLGGETGSFGADLVDVYLIRTDSLGEEQWSALYNSMRSGWDICRRIFIMDDGGYLLAGEADAWHELPDGNGQLYQGFDFALWRTEPDPLFNAAPREAAAPPAFQLLAAYPNPFNSATTIGFVINSQANVRLEILDLSGRLVAEIVGGQAFEAGNYRMTLPGDRLPAGIYFCRLETPRFNRTIKLTLVK